MYCICMDEHNQQHRDKKFPVAEARRQLLPIETFKATQRREKQMLATTAGMASNQGEASRFWARDAAVSRTRSNSLITLEPIDSDSSMTGSSTLNREAPNFWPSKPDLAACCQNMAAFLATSAAKSTTNGRNPVPTAGVIYGYIRVLFFVLELEPECCVYAYIYINRLLSGTGNRLKIRPGNWKKILVGTCLLASKYVDDLSMKNRDFATILNGWSLKRINQLECNIIAALKWEAYVPISEYTLRYFELAGPRVSTCDWEVNVKKVIPYFRVHSTALNELFGEILESQPTPCMYHVAQQAK